MDAGWAWLQTILHFQRSDSRPSLSSTGNTEPGPIETPIQQSPETSILTSSIPHPPCRGTSKDAAVQAWQLLHPDPLRALHIRFIEP